MQPLALTPSEVDFDIFNPGQELVVPVCIKNLDTRPRSFRVKAPTTRWFALRGIGHQHRLAPGLSITFEVVFNGRLLDSLTGQEYHDTIRIASKADKVLHIAVAASADPARAFGSWYLGRELQETVTAPGLYIVRLVVTATQGPVTAEGFIGPDQIGLEQVGRTQRFPPYDATKDPKGQQKFWEAVKTYIDQCKLSNGGDPKAGVDVTSNVYVVFPVGWSIPTFSNKEPNWAEVSTAIAAVGALAYIPLSTMAAQTSGGPALGSWASISFMSKVKSKPESGMTRAYVYAHVPPVPSSTDRGTVLAEQEFAGV